MSTSNSMKTTQFSLADTARTEVAAYLYELFSYDEGLLSNLDRWTQRRVSDESMAKLALVLESEDPVETCYRDLIREIDAEAENGIYLADAASPMEHLSRIVDDPGVSGELADQIDSIANTLFADEFSRSNDDLDLVWLTIQARHDRAHVNARVSEIIIAHLMGDADMASDMCNALRSLQYASHENNVRRCCNLDLVTDDRDERELMIMVSELEKRSGSYENRIAAINQRVNSL